MHLTVFSTIFTPSVAVASLLPLAGWAVILAFFAVRHRVRQIPLRAIRGPPQPTRRSRWLITSRQIFHARAKAFHEHLIKAYGDIIKINGLLGYKIMVSDPKACHSIFLKEQDVYEETSWFREMNRHAFGNSLVSTTGMPVPHYRKQGKMLNPLFSINHMRYMTPLFHKITQQLHDLLSSKLKSGPQELDMMDWMGRFALELIGQGGLGYTFGSLEGAERILIMLWRMNFHRVSKLPARFLRGVATSLPWPRLHRVIGIVDVMSSNAKKVFEDKKSLLDKGDLETVNQIGEGNDIISVLLKANMSASDDDKLPEEEVLAQMNCTDTTSSALSRILYLLAENKDVQSKLREELIEARTAAGGEIGYDELSALPYLEAVCRESLRVYPPVTFVSRTCCKDTVLPLSHPVQTSTGGVLDSLYLPKGTDVVINIFGINRSKAIWGPDAEEGNLPERWLAPLPETVEKARIPGVYSNMLTFLGGSRACIGIKFSQLERKFGEVALAQLISSFRFSPSKKEEVEWRFGVITTPGVKDASGPKLPMFVERIERWHATGTIIHPFLLAVVASRVHEILWVNTQHFLSLK
ncbi:cytochrome P450 [Auriscalpium vulgare]|uniref:Cytochrome P450 n=1 Tax=Auriscalpium vulgare TaxID=40419 RepID=A0ACB8S1Q7_9AGAM|nr:cytochrome P450 [Auriscalpium vulgare]